MYLPTYMKSYRDHFITEHQLKGYGQLIMCPIKYQFYGQIYDDEVDSNLAAVLFYAIKNPTL